VVVTPGMTQTRPGKARGPRVRPKVTAQVTVQMVGHSFVDPASNTSTTTINVGDSVRWKAVSAAPHTATADAGSFDTGTLNNGDVSKLVTFTKPGRYPYYCQFHGGPGGQGMSGTIIVK